MHGCCSAVRYEFFILYTYTIRTFLKFGPYTIRYSVVDILVILFVNTWNIK
jgi:hypothetical protein